MKIKEIRDNGGETIDRYTVVYDESETYGTNFSVSMNARPFHPQGIASHGECIPGHQLGKKIKFNQLPLDCQKLVLQDLKEVA